MDKVYSTLYYFIWEHGEEKLRNFVETLYEINPTITFTAERSQISSNFLDATVSLIKGQFETDFSVKPTDSHQYLHSSCQSYHCKKNIPYSQALHVNEICCNNNFLSFIVITLKNG